MASLRPSLGLQPAPGWVRSGWGNLSDTSVSDLPREDFLWGWGHTSLVSLPPTPRTPPQARRQAGTLADPILSKRGFPEPGLLLA